METLAVTVLGETGTPTGQDRATLALFLHSALLLARHGEGRLEFEAPDVMAPLKVGLPVHQLLLLQKRGDVGHLDVGVLGVQVFWIHL